MSGTSTPLISPTCNLNPSYCKFGAKTILDLLDGFAENIDGVIRNEDVECVHKTRVASRRLRAALPLFRYCFPRKEFACWSKEIKKVTKLLGEARDLDVQIAFVEKYLETTTQKKGLDPLLEDHKNRRNGLQSSVVKGLNKLKTSKTLEEIQRFCQENYAQQAASPFDPAQVLEKSHWHICFRLDDFLALKKYVHMPKQIEKHHEMRIAAKRLRYTMEFFAPLYENNLKEEIDTAKKYQDILGEKHDNEVWLDYIPEFLAKVKSKSKNPLDESKFEQALQKFAAYIMEQREQHYAQFVDLWDKNQKSGFFDKLRESSRSGPILADHKLQQVLSDPKVVVGVLSDVHANLEALEAVFRDAEDRGVTVFINAGDSVGFGPCPNEVIELQCQKNVLSIQGNYDLEVLEGKAKVKGEKKVAYKFAKKELTTTAQYYLNSLPRELHLEVGGKKLLVTHGSPKSIDEHIYRNTPLKRLSTLADDAEADVIIVGHSHEQFQKEANNTCFVNPGSVGRPGDGNPQAAYAVLTFNPFKVDLVHLDYDVEAAADALRRRGLPESFAQMLLRGVPLDKITEEDQAKQDDAIQDCRVLVKASEEFAQKHLPDSEHYRQVTKNALEFFDGLIEVHQLGSRERCWLNCASILHDVGLSKATGGHHKKSAQLILNDTQLPFTSQERSVIASIARYHRKGLPKQKHCNLAALDNKTVRKVKMLSGLLRVADGLDYTHESNVESLRFKIGAKKITVEVISKTESLLEEQAFNKKKDLFEKVFCKKMVLQWKQQ